MPPQVLVTSEHMVEDQKHDAATLWTQDITTTSFKICLRELQNFDGIHKNIHVVSGCTQPSHQAVVPLCSLPIQDSSIIV